jgi:L-aminopeptidase/D-esterase-like protein
MMSHDGLARTIDPVHTPYDGDTMFALATGHRTGAVDLALLGVAAARVTAMAVLNAVHSAQRVAGPDVPDLPLASELPQAHGQGRCER